MMAAAPSGVVTFLFTDVEGSTRRWEADAEGMRAALAAHDEALRKAIEAHGGWLFKHTGDGVCAAFGPRDLRPSVGLSSSDVSRCSRGGRSSTRVPQRPRLPHRRRLEIARPPLRTFSRRCSPRWRDSPVPM